MVRFGRTNSTTLNYLNCCNYRMKRKYQQEWAPDTVGTRTTVYESMPSRTTLYRCPSQRDARCRTCVYEEFTHSFPVQPRAQASSSPCAISTQNLTIIIIRSFDHIRIGLNLILSRCRCSLSCRCSQTRTRAPPRQRRTSSRVGYRTCRMTPRSFTHPTGCHSGDCTPAVTSTTPTNAILASLTSLATCPHVTFDWIGSFQGAGHVCSLTTTTNHRGQTLDLVFA